MDPSGGDRYRGLLGVADDHLVSSDIIRDPRASVVNTEMTQVVDGDLVQVMPPAPPGTRRDPG